nr:immunoglobulin heavy chain junction region [Macaca mulatta]MOX40018.1 immunoglobulin heavy chain junction region [Macaca mulatta]MOX40226.1 immunoglobulin heavy chain junction region [Macaca mulatta]MOX40551.1 immunoglobulin heavy chain junction region [Macaca mulatta]MOX40876.1 immunoglobulin heavy chain junction region [Macaca mulatta]
CARQAVATTSSLSLW